MKVKVDPFDVFKDGSDVRTVLKIDIPEEAKMKLMRNLGVSYTVIEDVLEQTNIYVTDYVKPVIIDAEPAEGKIILLPKAIANWIKLYRSDASWYTLGKLLAELESREYNSFAFPDDFKKWYISTANADETIAEAWKHLEEIVIREEQYHVKVPHTDDSYFYRVPDDEKALNAATSNELSFLSDLTKFTVGWSRQNKLLKRLRRY